MVAYELRIMNIGVGHRISIPGRREQCYCYEQNLNLKQSCHK